MIFSLRQVDRFLGTQEYNPRLLDEIPGLRRLAGQLRQLREHRALLWAWARRQSVGEAAWWEARRSALQQAHDTLLNQIRADYQAFGIKPVGTGLKGLQEAWTQVSDLVDRACRDSANLGPDPVRRQQQRLQAEGMVPTGPEPADPIVERARRVRAALIEATGQASEIEQLTERIGSIDIYRVDEDAAALQAQLRSEGMVSRSHPDVRPELAADLVALLGASQAPVGGRG